MYGQAYETHQDSQNYLSDKIENISITLVQSIEKGLRFDIPVYLESQIHQYNQYYHSSTERNKEPSIMMDSVLKSPLLRRKSLSVKIVDPEDP